MTNQETQLHPTQCDTRHIWRTIATVMLWFSLFTCAPGVHATRLDIMGIAGDLAENVRLFVGIPPTGRSEKLQRYINTLPSQTAQALAAMGYYGPDISTNQSKTDEADIVTVNIKLNDPVRINSVILRIDGEAQIDAGYMPVLGRIPLQKNAVFNSGNYESAKSILIDAAQDRGYFDFRFTTNTVNVSRLNLTADIKLIADSGSRYTFGQIRFEQDIFSDSFLNRWIPFTSGDPYVSGQLAELTQNLQNSGYFSSVRVLPQRDRRYGTSVPVRVILERRDNNQVGIGIGFATDTGPRTKFTWAKPLINRAGHSAEAELGISKVRQNASFSYRIPRENQPLYNYWGIEYGLQNEEIDEIGSFLSTLNFQRVRRFGSQWNESIFLRWEREVSTISDVESRTDLLLPGISYSRSRSRGSPFVTWGQSSHFQFMAGSRKAWSTIDFYKTMFSFKYLRAVSERNTFIVAVQYGAIQTNDFTRVPTSQRFFAGGDRSVRGYAYREVSPRNPAGDSVGGRYLEVSSIEHNFRLTDKWSLATFIDAGRAFNNFSAGYSVGAGAGIRWHSPVGPFRLDIGVPIDDPDSSGFRVHLSLGPDL